ncbi:MAG: thioredoxin-disulfide reductase [Clostridiales bacterium]|jgi:thioredoxin reductase (NADPH)|nr:thioredoxin-disulfide reductase [Clostridiales bacterium]
MQNLYDIIICGGGPAGLTAAIYCARGGVKAAVLERMNVGGQAALPEGIENYPGFSRIGGFELTDNMRAQAEGLGAEIVYDEAAAFSFKSRIKTIKTATGRDYAARAVILALGAGAKPLGAVGEAEFAGRGVSTCATCDGAFFRDKTACVAGGGNTAAEDALYLARFTKKVYLIHRRDSLRADAANIKKVLAEPKIEILWNTVAVEIMGGNAVERLRLKNTLTGDISELKTDALFIAVGQTPNTAVLRDTGVKLNESGYICVNAHMRANIKHIYAAGDCADGHLKQIVTACANGAVAATSAIQEL